MLLFLFLPVKTVAAVICSCHHPWFQHVSTTRPDGSPAPNHRCLFCMASRWTLPRAANGAEAGGWPCKAGSHGHESPEEIITG